MPHPASYTLIRAPQVLTNGTTYNFPAGCKAIEVECIGGGGAGGSADGNTSNTGAAPGGSGGGYCRKFIANPSGAYTYAIGAAGAKGAAGNNAGGNGGDTTFSGTGAAMTAKGGAGGAGSGAAAATDRALSGTAPQAGTTGGDVNIPGEAGDGAFCLVGTTAMSGAGGDSPLGSGGRAVVNAAGENGTGFGAGGGGASTIGNTDRQGGDGAPGVIVIYEYY